MKLSLPGVHLEASRLYFCLTRLDLKGASLTVGNRSISHGRKDEYQVRRLHYGSNKRLSRSPPLSKLDHGCMLEKSYVCK